MLRAPCLSRPPLPLLQASQGASEAAAPRAPAQLSEVQVKALAGGGVLIGAFVLFKMLRIIFGRRRQPGAGPDLEGQGNAACLSVASEAADLGGPVKPLTNG